MAESEHPASEDRRKPAIDLDRMNVQELTALIEAADAKRREKAEEAKVALLAEFRDKATAHGFTLESLLRSQPKGQPARKRKASGDKLPVKFRGPEGQEWSGRGKLPQWIAEAEKHGKKRDEFLIRK